MPDPQLRLVVNGLKGTIERVVKGVTLNVTANLIETTPVDTGWARANWVPEIGTPYMQDLEGINPTSDDAVSGASFQSSQVAKVAAIYKLPMGAVFVSNNVPYIRRLNDGSSTQAPAGFVQAAVELASRQRV